MWGTRWHVGEHFHAGWVLEDEPPRGGQKSLGTAASAAQQTGGDVLLLGSNSHRFITSAEELHLAFHPPTPPPPPRPPQERIRYDMCPEMFTLSLQTEEKGHKQCSPSY